MGKYKISVIMGIYNCASTLQEALDSLYAQTYQDFEIILCDDGSNDDTYKLALENQKMHPNIVLLKNPHNMGLNQTLNNCLAVAQGEYIARMDGDDLCDPTRFEKEIAFLEEHPEYAIVSTTMKYFDENGVFGQGHVSEAEPTKESFTRGTPFCHAPCMVRKEAYDAVGGYSISKWLLRNEDYNLWAKMYAKGYKGYNIDEPLYSMRDDRNAVVRRNIRNRINSIYSLTVAYRMLHFSTLGYIKNAMMQIIKIIMPTFIYNYFHRRTLKKLMQQ